MKKINILIFTLSALVILILSPKGSFSWYNDPKINSPVAAKNVNQVHHTGVSDGAGGAIISWAEKAEGDDFEFDIYAQRIDSHGDPAWSTPVAICTAPGFQGFPQIASDGGGGAIIVWHDSREGWDNNYGNFNIYAQRINGNGQIMWAINGIPICTAPEYQVFQRIVSDGMGGVIITWDDGRNGNHVYAQRVDSGGQIKWQQDGVLVCEGTDLQSDPAISYDGFGGAIIVWIDYRAGGELDIYAQKLDGNGNIMWGPTGVPLSTAVGPQFSGRVTSDGFGGGIFSWIDGRQGEGQYNVYSQRVDSNGTVMWLLQGIPIAADTDGSQWDNAIISDGVGGAIIVWEDGRKQDGDTDIYAQRVTAQGVPFWNAGGTPVVTTDEVQIRPTLISDGSGGAFITWMDFYRGGTYWNIYAQHIDGSGQATWKKDGIAVSIADETQSDPLIISDGSGGSIIVWYDGRSETYYNIYAQHVNSLGLLGGGEFRFDTLDIDGNPKTVFAPGELILFKSTWVMPAPLIQGTYQAESATVINSYTDFRHQSISYEVR